MAPVLSNDILLKAAEEFGTPLYVYDEERIQFQYANLQRAFRRSDVKIFYACKALTNINILRILEKLGSGIDCVSINEVQIALKAGFTPDRIIFTPNSVAIDEYLEATALKVNINIDNLDLLEQFGGFFGNSYPVIIRLNPHIMAGGNLKISTGHVDSKFGISIDQIESIKEIVGRTNISVKGIHIHTGSEIKDVDVFVRGLELMLELASSFPDLSVIDLGGGFKVPYKPDEKGTDMELLGEKLAETFEKHAIATGKRFQVWFEPGKFLVSECGYFLVKANIIKQSPSRTFVGVNSGFNHLIRPMFYDAYHKIQNLSNPNGAVSAYNVVGNICETDTFAWDRELNEVRPNDILLFNNAGAYGFEMSSRFNSRTRPAEVLVTNGALKLIRRRETLDDILEGVIL
ncbi:MAG: diaminopimelate decarboxylase [bacterium]|jgi:diaminopimelate decarboxylase